MNMYQLLERTAQTWPDNLYLVREGVTYKDFINLVKARAASLDAAGIKKGDIVGILAHNIPEFPITMFAIWYLGGTVLLLDTNLTPFEYDNITVFGFGLLLLVKKGKMGILHIKRGFYEPQEEFKIAKIPKSLETKIYINIFQCI